jgi:type IV secretory pathway TrbD component
MDWIKLWIKPVVMLLVWITVLSYTVSMVATVEPTLRRIGQMTERRDASL